MTDATPYTVPKEPGRGRALVLAALVHLALIAFLWIGIRWQSDTPIAIEAEVWSPETREAAPPPQPVTEPEPKPEVKEAPKPEVKEPPVVKPEPPVENPDIALEQEKKRKAEEKRREEERLAKKKEEEEKLAKLKKEEEEKRAKLKKEEEERLKKQKEEEEKLARKKAEEKQRAEKEALAKKAAEEKKRKEKEAEEQLLAKMREEDMRRMMSGVAGTGGAGDAARSQGARGDASYAQRVAAKIKSNINFNVPEMMPGNPAVEFEVKLLPDGSVAGIRKIKSSGVPGFDEAVSRAIEKAQPYPKDKSGTVPSSFIGIHRPKDQ